VQDVERAGAGVPRGPSRTAHWRISADRLELLDAAGNSLAKFEPRSCACAA
jgi:hypothetical protein